VYVAGRLPSNCAVELGGASVAGLHPGAPPARQQPGQRRGRIVVVSGSVSGSVGAWQLPPGNAAWLIPSGR
jgi:hypothetical protein